MASDASVSLFSAGKRQHSTSFVYRSYHLPMPSESINADSLNSNFLQLGRRSGGRPATADSSPHAVTCQHCDTHYFGRPRTRNLPIVGWLLVRRATSSATVINEDIRCLTVAKKVPTESQNLREMFLWSPNVDRLYCTQFRHSRSIKSS